MDSHIDTAWVYMYSSRTTSDLQHDLHSIFVIYIVDSKLHLTCSNCVTWHQTQSQVYIWYYRYMYMHVRVCILIDHVLQADQSLCVMND